MKSAVLVLITVACGLQSIAPAPVLCRRFLCFPYNNPGDKKEDTFRPNSPDAVETWLPVQSAYNVQVISDTTPEATFQVEAVRPVYNRPDPQNQQRPDVVYGQATSGRVQTSYVYNAQSNSFSPIVFDGSRETNNNQPHVYRQPQYFRPQSSDSQPHPSNQRPMPSYMRPPQFRPEVTVIRPEPGQYDSEIPNEFPANVNVRPLNVWRPLPSNATKPTNSTTSTTTSSTTTSSTTTPSSTTSTTSSTTTTNSSDTAGQNAADASKNSDSEVRQILKVMSDILKRIVEKIWPTVNNNEALSPVLSSSSPSNTTATTTLPANSTATSTTTKLVSVANVTSTTPITSPTANGTNVKP